jgi:hypothetical protein
VFCTLGGIYLSRYLKSAVEDQPVPSSPSAPVWMENG